MWFNVTLTVDNDSWIVITKLIYEKDTVKCARSHVDPECKTIWSFQVFIILEVASSLISTGSISEASKVRMSQKVAQFESGKCMHFVMAMLHNALPEV